MSDNLVTAKDTTMTFTTFVFFDMFNAMSCRSDSKSLFSIGVTTNRPLLYSIGASIVCQLMVIYVPFLQRIFQTEALSASELCKVTLLASTVWIADEMRKLAYLQRNSRKRQYKKLQESV
jgi:Ca2+-transporting ATPase